MIANRGPGRMVGASSFGAAIDYIVCEGPEHERDHAPPLAVWSENLASIETAALEMEAVASQSRAKESLYHLIVSFAEGERPTYEQARAALGTQWIDAFAELVGQKISVHWSEDTKDGRVFRVSNADGVIEDSDGEPMDDVGFAP